MDESGRAFLHFRDCFFCDFRGTYDEFPDDSIASQGVMACAECLKDARIARVMELMRNAERIDFVKEFFEANG